MNDECAWCGAEILPGHDYRNRLDEVFCTKAHRSASNRALSRLTGRTMTQMVKDRKSKLRKRRNPVHAAGPGCYQWGSQKVYCGPGAEGKATRQGRAIRATGWRERNPKPIGQCFPWAYRYLREHPDAILLQGTVEEPFSDPPHRYWLGWVVQEGKIKDWQTMEGPMAGGMKYGGVGWPIPLWMDMHKPRDVREYDRDEALDALAYCRHMGPWHGPYAAGLTEGGFQGRTLPEPDDWDDW